MNDREALAEAIHEGGWQIGANGREEWRWSKATDRERRIAYAKADNVLAQAAAASGCTDPTCRGARCGL